ncbi:hypothetical protein QFZ58_003162 [Streptomyces sp. B1I3]|nr:hypothetical protein [Streptomyces sp. B1I3]
MIYVREAAEQLRDVTFGGVVAGQSRAALSIVGLYMQIGDGRQEGDIGGAFIFRPPGRGAARTEVDSGNARPFTNSPDARPGMANGSYAPPSATRTNRIARPLGRRDRAASGWQAGRWTGQWAGRRAGRTARRAVRRAVRRGRRTEGEAAGRRSRRGDRTTGGAADHRETAPAHRAARRQLTGAPRGELPGAPREAPHGERPGEPLQGIPRRIHRKPSRPLRKPPRQSGHDSSIGHGATSGEPARVRTRGPGARLPLTADPHCDLRHSARPPIKAGLANRVNGW